MGSGINTVAGQPATVPKSSPNPNATTYRILFAISLAHLCNDTLQSVVPAIFPVIKESMNLSFTQIGWIYFTIQLTSSIMQPVFGLYSDRKPTPMLLPIGMLLSLIGMLLLSLAPMYALVLLGVVFIGLGSAVFHPEGSRVAHLAAGQRKGLAQSIFQVGGNTGSSMQPVISKWILIPLGQIGAIFFTFVAGFGVLLQLYVAKWYRGVLQTTSLPSKAKIKRAMNPERKQAIITAMILLIAIVLVRSWYSASISSFYAFYLEEVYKISMGNAQIYLLVFLIAGAVGTFFGGPLADRFGKRNVIALSMLGTAPCAMLVPFANEYWLYPLLAITGFILSSSFSVTVVYAQSLLPGRVGLVSGLIIGLAFGLGGIGALAIGELIEYFNISAVIQIVGFLPLLGLLSFMLPSDKKISSWTEEA
ncbi:MFS transporter [Paenibacillus albiflavus]|uniref:MFS transporter n=1 Tax=Paenibacillus albiflavus TaxID=2545760 RepID=A0A4R4EC97_9BACL|nr:MFS transporter [Paenibacillus albiflavus]TCZ75781.1 MFS transporter [Paenibacillus albiflavus]